MTGAPKILFVCETWAECDPSHGPSNAHHNFIGSFAASGLGTYQTFFFDEHAWRTKTPCDRALIEQARLFRPDIVFMTPVRGTDLNPSLETLAIIRAETGARIVVLNGDTCDEAGVRWCEAWAPVADRIVVQDCYSLYPRAVRRPDKYLPLWTPLDPRLFRHGDGPRDIDVSFLGSVARYPDRKRALGLLAAKGIDVARGGGQAEAPLTVAEYAAVLRRSKIVLNFARAVFDAPVFQCKGRVVEATLSGALLVEQANPETERWLASGVHYASFETDAELVDVVQRYLADEDARAAIAATGAAHAERTLSAAAYWRRVLDAAAVPVPA